MGCGCSRSRADLHMALDAEVEDDLEDEQADGERQRPPPFGRLAAHLRMFLCPIPRHSLTIGSSSATTAATGRPWSGCCSGVSLCTRATIFTTGSAPASTSGSTASSGPWSLPDGSSPEARWRSRQCNYALTSMDRRSLGGGPFFQTIRGVFVEGPPAYPGAGFHIKSHVQIAVRDPGSILGYFLPVGGYDVGEVPG